MLGGLAGALACKGGEGPKLKSAPCVLERRAPQCIIEGSPANVQASAGLGGTGRYQRPAPLPE